jgi:hypothetical protein
MTSEGLKQQISLAHKSVQKESSLNDLRTNLLLKTNRLMESTQEL